eukprot:11158363-Lingulodinium_polyedra.AAC.1
MLQPIVIAAGNVDVGLSGRCYYNCTVELMPQSEMISFGSKNWPAWACKRCHAASKALANA